MPDYTHVNLMELEETVSARIPAIEGRFGRTSLESEHLGVSHWRYAPNRHSTVGHRHREQEEVYLILSGSGRMRLGDDVVELRQWDMVRVAPSVVRAMEAGPDGLEYIAVGSDRPEGGDGEQIADFWPAEG
jgi:mannose-6-phosphate isomerase-like protein (cupin superfamily)